MVSRYVWVFSCLMVVLLSAEPAQAEIFRCQQPDGSALFSDTACAGKAAQKVEIQENSPLDSSAERRNIAQYQRQQAAKASRKPRGPQVVYVEDSYTEARNARLTKQSLREKAARKSKKKRYKKKKKSVS